MKLYPLLVNLEGRLAVVVGGGEVALRKVRDLLESGATVRVVSPVVHPSLRDIAGEFPGALEFVERSYMQGDLSGAFLAYTTSDNVEVNQAAASEARSLGILFNMTDDTEGSLFTVPSFTRKGDFILAVSTGGASPAMAARLRRELEMHIPSGIGDILDAMARARELLKSSPRFTGMTSARRGDILRTLANDDELLRTLVRADRDGRLAEFLAETGGEHGAGT